VTTGSALHAWEGRSVEHWRARWHLPAIIALDAVGSTNDVAREMADDGADAGLLVMTEHQTRGRGRMKRRWIDSPGRSLLMSIVLRPGRAVGDVAPGTAPIRVGIALARALRDRFSVDARLKWPNDVVVPGRGKLAGILCEAASAGGETVIIAGIGVNVFQQPDEWPADLRDSATSIAQVLARTPGRADIMDAIVAAMRPLFAMPLDPLDAGEVQAYASLDALRGLHLTTSGPDAIQGRGVGIAPDGALLIECSTTVEGRPAPRTIRRISSGTVRVTGSLTTFTSSMPP
jgi:BirA family biotin operon repressor/biotin-[acetyl-CoA-carboxylase] ligase